MIVSASETQISNTTSPGTDPPMIITAPNGEANRWGARMRASAQTAIARLKRKSTSSGHTGGERHMHGVKHASTPGVWRRVVFRTFTPIFQVLLAPTSALTGWGLVSYAGRAR